MRVGLVLDHYDPARGGVEQWTYQLACELLRRGVEVHVVAGGFGPALADSGIVPHTLGPLESRTERGAEIEGLLRTLDLDVVHDMGVGWYCDVFQPHGGSRLAAVRQNLQLIPAWLRPVKQLVDRCLPRYREFEELLEHQYADDGRIVLALSEMVRTDLRELHDVPDKQIRLIYNGVDTERFTPENRGRDRARIRERLSVEEDQLLFLIVAHNLRLKGVPALLRALARLADRDPSVRLAVVGGKRTRRFASLARRLGIADQVHFVGSVDDSRPYYAAADVYVQPTFYDPCSLVVLEALASGLPVITTRCNGAGELITSGEQGYVLDDPGDDAALADAMGEFLDETRRYWMSMAARELALQHPFSRNVDEVIVVYEEVVRLKWRRRRSQAT